MIQTENIIINGRNLTRTYSDSGHYIQRDGVRYTEAIDPSDSGRAYEEISVLIASGEATIEDYQSALADMGVKV